MELAILKSLETAYPAQLKRATVANDVERATDGFTLTEFGRALVVLERKGHIRVFPGEDVTRLKITDEGLNRLAAAR